MRLLLVEDNARLRPALAAGLEATGAVQVVGQTASGEDALDLGLEARPDVVLMDVQLAGPMNGIAAAVALRREFPRLPVVFYSIQDDDAYYRAFRRSGILSHYAYVRKSNYLLPQMIVPLLHDAVAGRSFVDPEIEARVQEVQQKDEQSPLALLEPNEQVVATDAGAGPEQRADRGAPRVPRQAHDQPHQRPDLRRLGPRREHHRREDRPHARGDHRDAEGRLLHWDEAGQTYALDERGGWQPFSLGDGR